MRSRAVFLLAVAAAVAMLVPSAALAQIGQGRLTGTVSDAQGAVLPGVTVTATSPSQIGARTTVTEADGKYLFPGMPSGTYKLTFELRASARSSATTSPSCSARRSRPTRRCRSAASPKA